MKPPKSKFILEFIQAPNQVKSLKEFEELVFSPSKLTFIETDFFKRFDQIANYLADNLICGNVVNIGIYKGGGALYMKCVFHELGMDQKSWWLFDSFQGFNIETINEPKELDTLNWFEQYLKKTSYPTPEQVIDLFSQFGLNNLLNIVPGFIEDTYMSYPGEAICLLHIDVDFYTSTYNCLCYFYPLIKSGGWIIVDDYYLTSTSCGEAVDRFIKEQESDIKLQRLGNYQAGWCKP